MTSPPVVPSSAPPPIHLSLASRGDLSHLHALNTTCPDAPWRLIDFAQASDDPTCRVFTARTLWASDPTAILGFLICQLNPTRLYILKLFVSPAARRQGLARALLTHALAAGRHHGIRRACLDVRASNTAARHLYTQFGFRPTLRLPAYYSYPIEDGWRLVTSWIQTGTASDSSGLPIPLTHPGLRPISPRVPHSS